MQTTHWTASATGSLPWEAERAGTTTTPYSSQDSTSALGRMNPATLLVNLAWKGNLGQYKGSQENARINKTLIQMLQSSQVRKQECFSWHSLILTKSDKCHPSLSCVCFLLLIEICNSLLLFVFLWEGAPVLCHTVWLRVTSAKPDVEKICSFQMFSAPQYHTLDTVMWKNMKFNGS